MEVGYTNTESDLGDLIKIINETNLTKEQIRKSLIKHKLYEYMDFKKDSVSLNRISLLFKDGKLYQITRDW